MIDIEEFAYRYSEEQANLLLYLYHLITSFPHIRAKISYRIPFYYGKSWICYTNPTKKGGVELAFVRGNELSDENNLLQARDRKQVSGITLMSMQEVNESHLVSLLIQAIELDRTKPYKGPKSK